MCNTCTHAQRGRCSLEGEVRGAKHLHLQGGSRILNRAWSAGVQDKHIQYEHKNETQIHTNIQTHSYEHTYEQRTHAAKTPAFFPQTPRLRCTRRSRLHSGCLFFQEHAASACHTSSCSRRPPAFVVVWCGHGEDWGAHSFYSTAA